MDVPTKPLDYPRGAQLENHCRLRVQGLQV